MRRSRTITRIAVALAAIAVLSATAPAAAQERLSLTHYLDMESVSDPRISPDGERIVYTRGWVDKQADRRESSLWIMNADGSRARHLLEGGGRPLVARRHAHPLHRARRAQRLPALRPLDGRRGRGQPDHAPWRTGRPGRSGPPTASGSPSPAGWPPGPTSPVWSFRAARRGPSGCESPRWWSGPATSATGRDTSTPAGPMSSWSRPRAAPRANSPTATGTIPASSGARTAARSTSRHTGKRTGTVPEHWQESEIYAVSVASGDIRRLTDRRGPDGGPVPSPDGSLIAYTGIDAHRDTYRNQRIHLMNRDGSGSRVISEGLRPAGRRHDVGARRQRPLLQRAQGRLRAASLRVGRWRGDAAHLRRAPLRPVVVLG